MMEPKSCLLLEKLPAELRVFIYEHVFQPQAKQLNFRDVEVPAKDLLLTCRQVYREALNIYQSAYRAFWRETRFIIGVPYCREGNYPELLASFNVRDLDQIRHTTIYSHTGRTYILLDTRGGWYWTKRTRSTIWERFICLREGRASTPEGPLSWPYNNYTAKLGLRRDVSMQVFREEVDMKAACNEPTPKVPMSDQIMKWIL